MFNRSPSSSPATAVDPTTRAVQALEQLWVEALNEYNVPLHHGRQMIDEIIKAHTAPERHYHNAIHLHEMSNFLAAERQSLQAPHEVALAVLFHDFVYSPSSSLNEWHSAQAARERLEELHIPETAIARIEKMILATKTHEPMIDIPDSRYFLDADLAILSREPSRYLEYAKAIRSEYYAFADAEYCTGRAAVMATFLARPSIYFAEHADQGLEQRARKNIEEEIRVLKLSASQSKIAWAQFAA